MPSLAGADEKTSGITSEFRNPPVASVIDGSSSRHLRRLIWRFPLLTLLAIFLWSRSLLLTSAPINADQRQAVMEAIRLIDDAGFDREVAILRHFANFRATDNWWNRHVGHSDAYAATNFPLGVVTLYEPFFDVASDSTERAAILLHEARHLWGDDEKAALEVVWREKHRLGWTAERYAKSRVFRNTREWTAYAAPSLVRALEPHP
jgi:hypothetical protein